MKYFRISDAMLETLGKVYEKTNKEKTFEEYCQEHIFKNLKELKMDETYHYRFYGGEEWWKN